MRWDNIDNSGNSGAEPPWSENVTYSLSKHKSSDDTWGTVLHFCKRKTRGTHTDADEVKRQFSNTDHKDE